MEVNKLREYLAIALDMEKNILLRKQLIAKLTEKTKQLGTPHTFTKPVKPQEWIPTAKLKDEHEYIDESSDAPLGCLISVGAGIFLLTLIILSIINMANESLEDFLLFVPVILWICCVVFGRWYRKMQREADASLRRSEDEKKIQQKRAQEEKAWRESMRYYHLAVRTYQQDIAKDKKRVQLENEQRELLRQKIRELTQDQAESERRLTQIYAEDIIFPKYRNLVAVASLYEYICAGRCSSLEGHEGAYNIYEAEVRLDRIVTQLDQVLAHLDAIQNNQFVLFTAVQEINRQCVQILQSVQEINQRSINILDAAWTISNNIELQLDSIGSQTNQINAQLQELQETSTLAAYHAERTKKELAYMNRMDYLSGRNDGVFFNHPPVQ